MEQNILENGKMINKMDMVFRNGQMVKYIKDNIKMEQRQAKAHSNFQMEVIIKDNF